MPSAPFPLKPLPPPKMPPALTLEKPATNLASLAISDSLQLLSDGLISQWSMKAAFEPLAQYGIRPIDRALFYGPPGNGKTVASQLIASRVDCPLYRVCCESLLTSAFGGSLSNISGVLDWLALQDQAVVLWDECESLFPNRDQSGADACTRELISTMQIFWQRLDRWSTPQLFLLATNKVDRLDPALLSRIDLKLEFGPPTQTQALDVVTYWQEVLHEYGSGEWGPAMRSKIEGGMLPLSFRDLWQRIAGSVRQFVLNSKG